MKTIITITFLVYFYSLCMALGNKQVINIWYFSALEDNDTKFITNLKTKLGKKFYKNYRMSLNNIYTNEKTIIKYIYDFGALPYTIVNNLEEKENEILSDIILNSSNRIITINDNPNKSHLNIHELIQNRTIKKLRKYDSLRSTELKTLTKLIRKTKKVNIDIIYYNGFLLNKNSCEYVQNIYENCLKKNDFR